MLVNISDSADSNTTVFNNSKEYSYYEENGDYDSYGDVYLYTAFSFERPFYLYILEIISLVTFLGNLVVISILLRRKMRNPTNIVLAIIAVSDSLTALVMLPINIMVYTRYHSRYDETNFVNDNTNYQGGMYFTYDENSQQHGDGCELTKDLCNGLMISKYFLAKSFHSMSIFLTLFLGIQRYISVHFPYQANNLLSLPRQVVCCVVIVFLSPFLHLYHLFGKRAFEGKCQWELFEDGCGISCIYLWLATFICQLAPCVILVIFTILFIRQLNTWTKNLRRMDSNHSQISRREDENRRISIIVTTVVVVFLIPEVPYSIFLLYNAIEKTVNNGEDIDLQRNRAINLVYELLLVLSFHANFYIYTFFNRRFRRTLARIYLKPIQRFLVNAGTLSQTSSSLRRSSNRKIEAGNSDIMQIEMKPMMISKP